VPKERTGSKAHMKRLVAPPFWPILRKERKWTVKPSPGPHPILRCLPLLIIVRDVLGYAKTAKEARRLIAKGEFKVDGKVRRDYKFPVGFMDVIEIPRLEEYYRVIPYPVKFMALHEISPEEAQFKLCRIENKTMIKGGNIQLNLHDGRNHIIQIANPLNPEEDVYRTYDVIKISIPKQDIMDHVKLEEGAIAIVTGGRNVGRVGRIREIRQIFKRRDAVVTLESNKGENIRTVMKYVFVLGKEEPLISLPKEVIG